MKKIGLLLVVFVISCTTLFAQNPQRAERKTPAEQAQQMAKEYNLTEQQTKDLEAFYQKQSTKRQVRVTDQKEAKENQRAEIEKQRAASDQELKKIIGDENFKKYEANRKAKQANRKRK